MTTAATGYRIVAANGATIESGFHTADAAIARAEAIIRDPESDGPTTTYGVGIIADLDNGDTAYAASVRP